MLGLCGSGGLLGEEFWQSDEIVGDGEEGEYGVGFFASSDFELDQSGTGLGPTKDFLDTFSASQADLVAWMARGAAVSASQAYFIAGVAGCTAIDGGFAPLAGFTDGAIDGDMGRHLARPQFTNEFRNIISLIGAQRDAPVAGTAVQHGQGSLALGGAGSVGKGTVHDQTIKVSISTCPI